MISEEEIIDTINLATDKFKELNGMLGVLLEVANDYHKRVKKAIEYIEQNKSGFKNYYLSDMELNYLYLLDILKGSDKE